jgi:prevent-host-death family protein
MQAQATQAPAVQVNILQAKNQLSQLIKLAQAGQEVVIANRGQPVVRLVATQAAAPAEPRVVRAAQALDVQEQIQAPGRAGGILKWLEENPLPAYLRRSAEEIDADILEQRNSWD